MYMCGGMTSNGNPDPLCGIITNPHYPELPSFVKKKTHNTNRTAWDGPHFHHQPALMGPKLFLKYTFFSLDYISTIQQKCNLLLALVQMIYLN